MIRFAPEPEQRPIPTGTEYRWPTTDGRWAIVQIVSDYVRTPRRIRFALVRCLVAGEYIVKRAHCRRNCVRLARELDAQPVKIKRRRRLVR